MIDYLFMYLLYYINILHLYVSINNLEKILGILWFLNGLGIYANIKYATITSIHTI